MKSPTRYVLANLGHFSFWDFCSEYKAILQEKEDAVRLLKTCLSLIKMSSRNPQPAKEQADRLLNDIQAITADARVDSSSLLKLGCQRRLSPTKYVFANLENFSFLEFCKTFSDTIDSSQKAAELLKGCLTRIQASSDPHAAREKAASLLKNIKVITADTRVDIMFLSKQRKLGCQKSFLEFCTAYLEILSSKDEAMSLLVKCFQLWLHIYHASLNY
ncbi:hypothetical protein V8B55DRAFT_1526361 [Mucor lusitanicus]|uniref:Uncharacterized protein n=2 Tax=Mucor circinelloides f. lusitanicus TaxID=29924 RepID=A0A168LXD2_MUCCL|nr:hypothetical protein FB192DRAFT_1391176 [Mucor lusitanicus]OAD04081.1 hypothetical protein MUCCIDRAFT_156330 [Mucor lusitanicus CBS 277.49]